MANYKDWIKSLNINIDYFSAFMKAWIAFNAWYDEQIPGRTDKDKIEYIANNSNVFKSYINGILSGSSSESLSFFDSLAKLHELLLETAIPTQEFLGVRQQISFNEIAVKNFNRKSDEEYRNICYKCERGAGSSIITTIKNKTAGTMIFDYTQDEYDKEALLQQSEFKSLRPFQQEKCLKHFENLRPYVIESVLETTGSGKSIGVYLFVNSEDKNSRAIILILYLLRCSLAHGDIPPDEKHNLVYKYAYEILIVPLKKLL